MRRKDREITDPERIDAIISSCDCLRLGFSHEEGAYIVPLCFGFENENNVRTFYFHSAREGRKIELIKKLGRAGFELDTGRELNAGAKACDCSLRYQSVTGTGEIEIIEQKEEKLRALGLIMEHYTGKADWDYNEKELAAVTAIRLRVKNISCKEHL